MTASQGDEAVVDVDMCNLSSDTFAFDRKLVRVTGLIARDFETFWIEGEHCAEGAMPLWIEYGGPKPADGPRWYGDLEHPPDGHSPLWIEGFQVSLEADPTFQKFDSLTKSLRRGRRARATIVGRVFSTGVYKDEAGETQEIGYGPYGMYSLFVIHKVERVARK
jgi:hypothetical protein